MNVVYINIKLIWIQNSVSHYRMSWVPFKCNIWRNTQWSSNKPTSYRGGSDIIAPILSGYIVYISRLLCWTYMHSTVYEYKSSLELSWTWGEHNNTSIFCTDRHVVFPYLHVTWIVMLETMNLFFLTFCTAGILHILWRIILHINRMKIAHMFVRPTPV